MDGPADVRIDKTNDWPEQLWIMKMMVEPIFRLVSIQMMRRSESNGQGERSVARDQKADKNKQINKDNSRIANNDTNDDDDYADVDADDDNDNDDVNVVVDDANDNL